MARDDIAVETLEGDPLGHTKDRLGGQGANYHLLCYIPDERQGKSRISVDKERLTADPIVVEYDTVRTVRARFTDPVRRGLKIEIPVSFGFPIQHLKKRNFSFSVPTPYQIYGTASGYQLRIPARSGEIRITISDAIRKQNGVPAEIQEQRLEVGRGTIG